MSNNWQRWKNVMKCYPFSYERLAKWQPPYIVQPKFNGFRCRAVSTESGTLLLSSEENIFFSVPHLNKMFDKLKINLELDGELYVHGMSFEQLSSILSRTVNLHPDHTEVEFHCFDVISDQGQLERLFKITELTGLHPKLQISPFYIARNFDDVMRIYDSLINSNYEGIIVRHKDNFYSPKRSTFVMKFKPKKTDTYEIIGFEEETSINGNPKNSLGSLVLKSGDGQTFSVGTGFTSEQRKKLWINQDYLIGSFATINYQHLTNRKVPMFPVFLTIN